MTRVRGLGFGVLRLSAQGNIRVGDGGNVECLLRCGLLDPMSLAAHFMSKRARPGVLYSGFEILLAKRKVG